VGAVGTLRRWVDGSQADGTFLQRLVTVAVGLAVIASLVLINTVVFRVAFDSDYLHWYLKNGALIGIIFGLITLAWGDLNRMTTLISAHPHEYVSTCFRLGVLPMLGSSALIATRGMWLKKKHKEREELEPRVAQIEQIAADPELSESDRQQVETVAEKGRKVLSELTSDLEAVEDDDAAMIAPPGGLGPIDVLLAVLFSFAFMLLFALWMLVIAPIQYVINLVAGAPARRALASPVRALFRSTPGMITVAETPKRKELPKGATESKFSTSPVAFTSAIASALLFLASTFAPI
jgi:hypothetical protein